MSISALVLVVAMTTAASPSPPATARVFAQRALLRDPVALAAVGHIDDAVVTLGPWINDHIARVAYRGAAFDVDAAVDLDDAGTQLSVTVSSPVVLTDTGPWVVVMTPDAVMAVGARPSSTTPTDLVVIPMPADGLPFSSATLSLAATLVPALVDDDEGWGGQMLTCQPKRLYASAQKKAPSMPTPYTRVRVQRQGPAVGGFVPAAIEVAGFVVFGYARTHELACDDGDVGGLGLRGTGGASDGFIMAREAKLPSGARFFALGPADESLPIAVFRRPVVVLKTDDGSWRVPNIRVNGVTLGLHSVRVEPQPADDAFTDTAMRTHGIGNAFSVREDWPRLPRGEPKTKTKKATTK